MNTPSITRRVDLRTRAFTLIELLIVIAIMALLTGIIISSLTGSRAKARDAKRVSDIGQIQIALELFYDRCRVYPDNLSVLDNGGNSGGACPSGITFGSFIPQIPTPPSPSPDAAGYQYLRYSYYGTGVYDTYALRVALEQPGTALQDDIDTTPTRWNVAPNVSLHSALDSGCSDSGGPYPNQYCIVSD